MSTTAPTPSATTALRTFDDLPGPRGLPVFGNLLQIETSRVHQQMERWCDAFGSIYRLRLGKRRVIVVGDHDLVAAALRDRPDGFRRTTRLEEISAELGIPGGVFGATGEAWKRQRRMVMAGFDPAHIKRYFPSLQRVTSRLVTRWGEAAARGTTIDLQADLMRFTVDAIAGLAFGADVNTLQSDEDRIQNHLNRIFPAIFKRIFAALPTWRWYATADDRALVRSVAEVNAAVDRFIAEARARLKADPARREKPPNLLEAMLVAAEEPGSGITDREVAGNVFVMLLAGEDTTANTVAWMIWLLARHPEALAKARDEVRRVCPDPTTATFDDIARLEYVEACAHETMRLRPVAPQQGLQALRDTVIGDVQVRKGMIVFAIMRRDSVSERYVPNAKAFEPERWLSPEGTAAAANSAKRISMPFGAGPRICPGRYLALLEMKMAMAALLANFDIVAVDTPDGEEPREVLQIAMMPVGLTMRLRRLAP
ncbi:MAG TPA: cytochrome P450 [Caldimonas sp.]|nr:cytochrome P450 [Caldimonas sp.]